MNEEKSNKLKGILSAFDDKKEQSEQERVKIESNEDLFLKKFQDVCQNFIKPVMLEIMETVKIHGHECKVEYSGEHKDSKQGVIPPSISMEIFPKGTDKNANSGKGAHVSFVGDKKNKKIWIHENTIVGYGGGHAGSKNTKYTFDTLTQEITETEIIESLNNILNKK